ncbi:MAG: SusD/RagB family nutrient-binding outer membrane lipoprotein, partial [Chitinophagaceae bacterium]
MNSCRKKYAKLNTGPGIIPYDQTQPEGLFAPMMSDYVRNSRNDMILKFTNFGMPLRYFTANTDMSGRYYPEQWNSGEDIPSMAVDYSKFYAQGTVLEEMLYSIDNRLSPSEKDKRQYLRAIVQIMKTYMGWRMHDVAGDVPYTEANKARYGGTLTPVYDKSQELYKLFDTELTSSIEVLLSGLENQLALVQRDFVYGYTYGNGTTIAPNSDVQDWAKKWAKFAHMIRLKIAWRYKKVDPTNFDEVFVSVTSRRELFFKDGTEEAVWVSAFDFLGNREDDVDIIEQYFPSKSFVEILRNNDDPRLTALLIPNMYGPSIILTSFQYSLTTPGVTLNNIDSIQKRLKELSAMPQNPVKKDYYVGYTSNPQYRQDNITSSKDLSVVPVVIYDGKNGRPNISGIVGTNLQLDTMSRVETTFWLRGSLDGDDVNWHYVQPFISYADVC